MAKYDEMKKRILLMDGAMGTMIQKYGAQGDAPPETLSSTNPQLIASIHKSYVDAGADIIYANTFGANRYKYEGLGYSVEYVIKNAIKVAKAVSAPDTLVAMSIGPTGKLMEPMGDLTFDDAYDAFAEIAVYGQEAGADLIAVETMTDIYEAKAAVLAVKENTDLPVFVSMSFEKSGRTFSGCGVENMVLTLEPLGVDAIGINCSLGPDDILPIADELCHMASVPVFIKPNAGLPDPETGEYSVTARQFASQMQNYIDLGVNIMGGCCGTTPEFIKEMKKLFDGVRPQIKMATPSVGRICSSTRVVYFDHRIVIGERINPTGKPKLREALETGDYGYIRELAVKQVNEGAEILDVNVGAPGIDEVEVLPEVVRQIQSVTDVPLQIDSSNFQAVNAALRVYNGKALVNSVDGQEKNLKIMLAIAKHYGAALVGLTIGDEGIPGTALGRLKVAEEIAYAAEKAGIKKNDLIIDCLTLAVSAEEDAASRTLEAVALIKKHLGLQTVLGVSNVSFGLPQRPIVNRTFLALALQSGLDMAIMNPGDEGMMDTIITYRLLHCQDRNAEKYIERMKDRKNTAEKVKIPENAKVSENSAFEAADEESLPAIQENITSEAGNVIRSAILNGLEDEVTKAVEGMLKTHDPMTVVNDFMMPALDETGKKFEAGDIFLPQMIKSANAAQAGFKVIRKSLENEGKSQTSKGDVVLATVKGDIHDIGKNIVASIMENYGYNIIDLGKDVSPEKIADVVKEHGIRLLGLSALMTTTLPAMEETIKKVRTVSPECRIMVGGAVLTNTYAKKIGADFYCRDAIQSVQVARFVFGQ